MLVIVENTRGKWRLHLIECNARVMQCSALVMEFTARLMECMALLIESRALLKECSALFVNSRALVMEFTALLSAGVGRCGNARGKC